MNDNNDNDKIEIFHDHSPYYNEAEKWCHDIVSMGKEMLFNPTLFKKEMFLAARRFEFNSSSLHSLLRNISLLHVKRTATMIKKNLHPKYVQQYKEGISILSLAKLANYPPYLFARYIVEAVADFSNSSSGSSGKKKILADAMRDPDKYLNNIGIIDKHYLVSENSKYKKKKTSAATTTTTTMMTSLSETAATTTMTTRLAAEVKEAISSDPMYGPVHDKDRHIVGIEYEVFLEKGLHAMNIPFETEAELRNKGTSRTPDILLSIPLGVEVTKRDGSGTKEWKVVCWIDSKAMFGDEVTHRTSVLQQAETYVHRFGPGLILYWLGHAPINRLGDAHGDITIAAYEIPIKSFIWPTGDPVVSDNNGVDAIDSSNNIQPPSTPFASTAINTIN